MRLIDLKIARGESIVRTVAFKQGLNLILDRPTTSATHSGNNVGKTTLLRLIDFCLGSDGKDIWQDAEFPGAINQDVHAFLTGTVPASITLRLRDEAGGEHTSTRHFSKGGTGKEGFEVDGATYKSANAFKATLKELLFGSKDAKPTLRQLIPKFVRSSPERMRRTLRFLGDYGSKADYEALHLFLFGFFATDVLGDRLDQTALKKSLSRDLEGLNRLRKEGEIEQLLLHLQREIRELSQSNELRGEVPEIAERANLVSRIRATAAQAAGNLSRIEGEIFSLNMTIREFEEEFSGIDRRVIESIYKEAGNYIPKLQHDWEELSAFVQNLRTRKRRFLQAQIETLHERAEGERRGLAALQLEETDQIGALVTSAEFEKALQLRSEMQEKYKLLGSLEEGLKDRQRLREQIEAANTRLKATSELIEREKGALRNRVDIFNKHFSELSALLYGEKYLLHFDENDAGSISFELTAVGSNVGAGKKASQTAAFDLAYIDFLHDTKINFPKFVCHDGVEAIHDNQLAALLQLATKVDGQLIVATLRDKLPPLAPEFLQENTVLELGQDDKLFGI